MLRRGDKNVTVTGTLGSGNTASAPGDIGVLRRFIHGSHRFAQPRQQPLRRNGFGQRHSKVLFNSGTSAGTHKHHRAAGKYLAFYTITSGTTSSFLLTNPTDDPNGGPVALFSFYVANPNAIEHFRWTSPETATTDPSKLQLHIMDQVFGSDSDFDDLTVALSFSA